MGVWVCLLLMGDIVGGQRRMLGVLLYYLLLSFDTGLSLTKLGSRRPASKLYNASVPGVCAEAPCFLCGLGVFVSVPHNCAASTYTH